MEYGTLQYVLVCLLAIGISYFLYLLKDKNNELNEDYFKIDEEETTDNTDKTDNDIH